MTRGVIGLHGGWGVCGVAGVDRPGERDPHSHNLRATVPDVTVARKEIELIELPCARSSPHGFMKLLRFPSLSLQKASNLQPQEVPTSRGGTRGRSPPSQGFFYSTV